MKKLFIYSLILWVSIHSLTVLAQESTQMLRGKIIDSQSKNVLIGANVLLVGSEPIKGSSTDSEGIFRIKNAPLGRNTLKITYVGYKDIVLPNIVVNAGKETVLEIELEENITLSNEVVVVASRSKTAIEKGLISVSGTTFDVEETRRFSGSRNDPSRMVANFAGVVGNNDARNDIIIRGNSPTGVLWRLEGIDIPNPNHFGALGATGGPVTMLNNNLLARSSFLTGAFPANYGNAIAGVFDLQMRSGNNEKREYTGQVGFNGIELGIEGAFSKKSKASYLIHYRYSVLDLLKKLGIGFGTGTGVPRYQDASFKVDIPTEKIGKFAVFGMIGNSSIAFNADSSGTKNFYTNTTQNTTYNTNMGVVGLSHLYYLKPNVFLKTTLAYSSTGVKSLNDSVAVNKKAFAQYRSNSTQNKVSIHAALTNKINASNTFLVGVIADKLGVDYADSTLVNNSEFQTIRQFKGSTYLLRGYGNWQWKPLQTFTINAGLYGQYFGLNGSTSLEPRVGMRYAVTPNKTLSLGLGRHSQLQDLSIYFNNQKVDNINIQSNRNLGFTISNQAVFGYETTVGNNIRFKAETYFQSLEKVPVQMISSAYSVLNEGADFKSVSVTNLVNKGTGENYGIELTLERNFINNYYFLSTLSLYESTYKGSDGIEHNTAYSGNYVANLLGGREFKVGKRGTFGLDIKLTAAGGKRATPYNIKASLEAKKVIYTDDIYGERLPDYFRTDVKLSFRLNRKKITEEWFIDLQNVTNRANIYSRSFNPTAKVITYSTQQGFFPTFNYRIQF